MEINFKVSNIKTHSSFYCNLWRKPNLLCITLLSHLFKLYKYDFCVINVVVLFQLSIILINYVIQSGNIESYHCTNYMFPRTAPQDITASLLWHCYNDVLCHVTWQRNVLMILPLKQGTISFLSHYCNIALMTYCLTFQQCVMYKTKHTLLHKPLGDSYSLSLL